MPYNGKNQSYRDDWEPGTEVPGQYRVSDPLWRFILIISYVLMEKVKELTGYYDETMRTCEDYDLWMRIAEHFMVVHIAKSLTLVRVQPKNSTDTVAKDIWQRNWTRVHQKTQQRHEKTLQQMRSSN